MNGDQPDNDRSPQVGPEKRSSPSALEFRKTTLPGCLVVDPGINEDERGIFARTYSRRAFEAFGLNPAVEQCSVSRNRLRGTLRGLHYQAEPNGESKLVTCTRGKIFDVAVDLRGGSPTYMQWTSTELSSANLLSIYIPVGLAHGFVTLDPDSEVRYQISTAHREASAAGIRWDDPDIGIVWPDIGHFTMSERDRALPYFRDLDGTVLAEYARPVADE